MSKTDVKKYVMSLDKTSLVNLVMDLYTARKEAKEFLEYAIRPNDKEKFKEYKEIITKEFFPKRGDGKMRFSVCKKAVKDFKTLNPSTHLIADLMLYIPECASEVANGCGDLWDSFYDSSYTNFEAAMKYVQKNGLQSKFQARIEKILKNCEGSGYGFPDSMYQIYYDYSDGAKIKD